MAEGIQAETRRLAAIMFTDIVGFSRQRGADETRMLRLLDIHNRIVQQAVSEHHGLVIKTVGDAFLTDFPSIVHASQCAQPIQGLHPLSQAYVHAGRYEEAIPMLKQVLAYNPNNYFAHWGLAVSYSELGREEEARAAGVQFLRIMPQFSIERWKRMAPYKDLAVTERFAAAMRKAGLK